MRQSPQKGMNNLKFHRLSKEITQLELEALSGVNKWKISLAENGNNQLAPGEANRIARALEISPKLLFENTEKNPYR